MVCPHGMHNYAVFGWFNDSFIGEEREDPYSLQVGYQKGAQDGHEDLAFSISVEPTNSGANQSSNLKILLIFFVLCLRCHDYYQKCQDLS